MGWVKLEDRYARHPKIMQAGEAALALDICGMCFCREHNTNGFIPLAVLTTLGPVRQPRKAAKALEQVGRWRWDADQNGWWVHDFGAYNPDSEAVSESEAARRAKAKKAAAARWGRPDAPSNAQASTEHCSTDAHEHQPADAQAMPPSPPHPPGITSPPPLTLAVSDRAGVVEAALEALATRERSLAPAGSIKSPAAWTRKVIESNRHAFGGQLHRLAHEHPDWTSQQLADAITNTTSSSNGHVERPICEQCNRHTSGLVECPNAAPSCPTMFTLREAAS